MPSWPSHSWNLATMKPRHEQRPGHSQSDNHHHSQYLSHGNNLSVRANSSSTLQSADATSERDRLQFFSVFAMSILRLSQLANIEARCRSCSATFATRR